MKKRKLSSVGSFLNRLREKEQQQQQLQKITESVETSADSVAQLPAAAAAALPSPTTTTSTSSLTSSVPGPVASSANVFVYLLMGIHGSGKTAFAQSHLLRDKSVVRLGSDDAASTSTRELAFHIQRSYLKKRKKYSVADKMVFLMQRAVDAGARHVILDGTHLTELERQPLLAAARTLGARVHGYLFSSVPTECWDRIQLLPERHRPRNGSSVGLLAFQRRTLELPVKADYDDLLSVSIPIPADSANRQFDIKPFI